RRGTLGPVGLGARGLGEQCVPLRLECLEFGGRLGLDEATAFRVELPETREALGVGALGLRLLELEAALRDPQRVVGRLLLGAGAGLGSAVGVLLLLPSRLALDLALPLVR